MRPTIKESITRSIALAQHEMVLTLPKRLLMAFSSGAHKKYIDPGTNKPFTSFYFWLMAMPPPGCGLAGSLYIDAGDIIYQLEKCRGRVPDSEKGPLNGLIEELVKGYGAAKPAGRHKKEIATVPLQLNGEGRHFKSTHRETLAARLAESTDPKIRKEWKAYLEGKHGSVTRAAIAAGMIEDSNAPLNRLKQNWRKTSAAERQAFLEFIQAPSKIKLILQRAQEVNNAQFGPRELKDPRSRAFAIQTLYALKRWIEGERDEHARVERELEIIRMYEHWAVLGYASEKELLDKFYIDFPSAFG